MAPTPAGGWTPSWWKSSLPDDLFLPELSVSVAAVVVVVDVAPAAALAGVAPAVAVAGVAPVAAAAACVSLAAVADGIVLAAAAGVRVHAGGHPQSLGRGLRRCRRSRSRQT